MCLMSENPSVVGGNMVFVMVTSPCCVVLHSYVLTGTDQGFQETFGSTCHGAVSAVYFV